MTTTKCFLQEPGDTLVPYMMELQDTNVAQQKIDDFNRILSPAGAYQL
jgi:hypothetical protein